MHDSRCSCEKFLKEGFDLMQQGAWAKAQKCYEKAIAIHEDNEKAWGMLGLCHDSLGNQAEALECYDKSLHYNPSYVITLLNKGCMFGKAKKFKDALNCFDAAIQVDPLNEKARRYRQTALRDMAQEGAVTVAIKDITLINKDDKYFLKIGDDLVKTPNGNVIEAKTKTLLSRIITDFEGQGDLLVKDGIILKPRVLSAYVLESSKRDFMDEGDPLFGLSSWLGLDPVFEPTAGHPVVAMYQEEQRNKAKLFLGEHGLSLTSFSHCEAEEIKKVFILFQEIASGFSGAQKSILINLSKPNGNNFVMTFLYLLGRCNEMEWAKAIFSRTPDVCRITGESPIGGIASVPDGLTDEDRQSEIGAILSGYEEECLIAKRYLEATIEES